MPVVISTAASTTATYPGVLRLSQHIAPAAIVAAGSAFPYKDVIRGGYSKVLNAPKVFSKSPIVVCKSDFPKLSICTSSGGPRQQLHARASKEKPGSHPLAAAISVFGDPDAGLCRTSGISRARKSLNPPRAYKENFFSFRLPVMTEKPEWWWRTLACVPYLIALQISDAGYYLHPLLEHYDYFGDLIFFVPGAISRLPTWFSMVYLYFAYVGIVKNKEWPHFFRYHLMMGMLLETALQIVWHVSNFMPLIHYNGRFGMYYWAGVGFAYILILLQCVRCALAGGYAHLPFISDAAYIHTLFNIGGFQRPFK